VRSKIFLTYRELIRGPFWLIHDFAEPVTTHSCFKKGPLPVLHNRT